MRWTDGVVRCTVCGCDRVSKITRKTPGKNKRAQIYQCLETSCKSQFSATSGTIFADSHLPLHKWFLAMALVLDAKKGMSAKQLQEHLGIGSYRTAWYMCHRIRKAMDVDHGTLPKMRGIVEMDETYIGGKTVRRGKGRGRSKDKDVVVALRQRGGDVRFVHVPDVTAATLQKVAEANIDDAVGMIVTDDFRSYPLALKKFAGKHSRINHSLGYYVTGDIGEVHTNTVESAFSLFKRGLNGSFHIVSIKHLHRYLSEFEYRFNERKNKDRFRKTMRRMMMNEPVRYAELTAHPELTEPF
jgi:transposase-like protein